MTSIPKYDFAVSKVPVYVQPSLTSAEMQKVGQTSDPDSLASISQKVQVLEQQAVADSEFDAAVPEPRRSAKVISGFCNESDIRLALVALLIVGGGMLLKLSRSF